MAEAPEKKRVLSWWAWAALVLLVIIVLALLALTWWS